MQESKSILVSHISLFLTVIVIWYSQQYCRYQNQYNYRMSCSLFLTTRNMLTFFIYILDFFMIYDVFGIAIKTNGFFSPVYLWKLNNVMSLIQIAFITVFYSILTLFLKFSFFKIMFYPVNHKRMTCFLKSTHNDMLLTDSINFYGL